jgi:predicted O-methyltransferase YrrM
VTEKIKETAKEATKEATKGTAAGARVTIGGREVTRKDVARLEQADKYSFLWHKAAKRIEIRDIPGFGELAASTVEEHRTGMRQDRLYTLWQAMAALPDNDRPIVEVGAYKGGSARFMAESMRLHHRTRRFFVADTFSGHVVVDETLDGPHRVGEQFTNNSADEVAGYLSAFPEVQLIVGDFRETSARLEPDAPFAFAHLDVDVYPVMSHALAFFADRLEPGGLIVVDDYGFVTCRGARQAVDEFRAAHRNYWFFHLLTGQALLVRVS